MGWCVGLGLCQGYAEAMLGLCWGYIGAVLAMFGHSLYHITRPSLLLENSKQTAIQFSFTLTGCIFRLFSSTLNNKLSAPYTPQQNGLAERINRTLLNKVRVMLFQANLPQTLWGEALLAAVFIYNRSPHSYLHYKTPYEARLSKKPDISNIKV